MLETVIHALRAHCAPIVVVAHAGQLLPALPGEAKRVDDPVHLDDQGPLVGVQAGLAALDDDDVVYLAATDKPHLTPGHVEWMFDRLGDADGLVPVEAPGSARKHRMHPLAGVLRVGPARAIVDTLVRDGERALRLAFERLDAKEVLVSTLPDPDVLRDYNTPQAYGDGLKDFAP